MRGNGGRVAGAAEQAALAAVELALAEGVATRTHVPNILHRLVDGKTSTGPDIGTPDAQVPRRERRADAGRNDTPRARTAGGRHAS